MSESTTPADDVAYHLTVEGEESRVAARALRLMIADEAHHPEIRVLARGVLAELPGEGGSASIALTAEQMKVLHGALRSLLLDLQREQADERRLLWELLDKLPDEHTIRAIELP